MIALRLFVTNIMSAKHSTLKSGILMKNQQHFTYRYLWTQIDTLASHGFVWLFAGNTLVAEHLYTQTYVIISTVCFPISFLWEVTTF